MDVCGVAFRLFSHLLSSAVKCEICLKVIPTFKYAPEFYNTSSQLLTVEGLRPISLHASKDIMVVESQILQ